MLSLIQLPQVQCYARSKRQYKEKVPTSRSPRAVIAELLSECHIPFYRTPYNRNLHNICIQECRLKGYPIDKRHGKASVFKYLPSGVILASTAYAHLQSRSAQVFIAIYTAFMTWLDDTYSGDIQGVENFNKRFAKGQQQDNEGLDGLDRMLREIDLHWDGVQANVILTATLNFTASLILELKTRGMKVPPHAQSYATLLRVMSGIGEAYAMFTFPPELPISTYVEAIPEFCLFIGYMNHILSFYKEERVAENGNYISKDAKLTTLRELAHDASLCECGVANLLEGHRTTRDAFQGFKGGYASFHTFLDTRYHLDQLFLLQ